MFDLTILFQIWELR